MTIMLGKVEGSRKRRKPTARWTDTLKEDTEFTVAVEGRTFWKSLIHRVTVIQR